MKYRLWKEADKRAVELKPQIDALNDGITASEKEARGEDLTVEKRGEVIDGIKTQVEKRDALQSEYDEAIQARDELKASEERQFGLLNNLTSPRIAARSERTQDDDVYATRAYEMAWANYIRTGSDAEARSLVSTASTGSAGLLVPKTLADKIEDTLRKGGRLINLCDTVSIKGITEFPVALGRTDPALHRETGADATDPTKVAAKKEKAITLTSVKMDPQFIAEILRTTQKFETDSISAFWDWLVSVLPDALRRVIDRMILNGGQGETDGIHGILTNTNKLFVETLGGHALNFNTANAAVAMLDDGVEDNITLVMHRKTFFNNVMGLKGLDDHPIWKQASSNTERPTFVMGGYPVVFSGELPAYDDAGVDETYMVAGDFHAMKLNFPEGMNVKMIRDEITEADRNLVRYISQIYVAGNITKPGSFVKVTK